MKKILSAVLVIVMLLSMTSFVTIHASDSNRVNLALNEDAQVRFRKFSYLDGDDLPANGSDEEGNGGWRPEYAIDGDESTKALPSMYRETSIWLDLGASYSVDGFEVVYSQRPEKYEIYLSNNASLDNTAPTWYKPVNVTNGTATLEDVTVAMDFAPQTFRYVLVRCGNGGGITIGQGVREIRVFGAKSNLATGVESINLTYRDGSAIAESNTGKLVDGSFTTACGPYAVGSPVTDYSWNATFALPEAKTIDKVGFVINTCKGNTTFNIETSDDGVTYKPVGTITVPMDLTTYTNGNRYFSVSFYPVSTKYVRIIDASAAHPTYGVVMSEVYILESFEEAKNNVLSKASNVSIEFKNGEVATANNGGVAALTDNNYATYCGVDGSSSDSSNPYAWNVIAELDKAYVINSVDLILQLCRFQGSFDIETSVDGVNYTKSATINTTGEGDYNHSVSFAPVPAKYIRIVDNAAAHPQQGFRIADIAAYEAAEAQSFYCGGVVYDIVGTKIDSLQKGSITSTMSVYSTEVRDVVLISGLYEKDTNKVIRFDVNETSVDATGLQTIPVTVDVKEEIAEENTTYEIRTFLWDSLNGLTPLSNVSILD